MKCADCRFFAPQGKLRNADFGDCRRRAPRALGPQDASTFPSVYASSWCGEFEAKDAPKSETGLPADVEHRVREGAPQR